MKYGSLFILRASTQGKRLRGSVGTLILLSCKTKCHYDENAKCSSLFWSSRCVHTDWLHDYYGRVLGGGVTVGLIRHWWWRYNRKRGEGRRKNNNKQSRDKHRVCETDKLHTNTNHQNGGRRGLLFYIWIYLYGWGVEGVGWGEGIGGRGRMQSDRSDFLHPGQTSGATYIEERGFKGLHGAAMLPAFYSYRYPGPGWV